MDKKGHMAKNVGPAQTPTHGKHGEHRHAPISGGVKDPAFVNVGNNRGPVSGFDGGARQRKC